MVDEVPVLMMIVHQKIFALDLSYANLRNVKGVTNEELEYQTATIEDATMPNAQKYEDWHKSCEGEGG